MAKKAAKNKTGLAYIKTRHKNKFSKVKNIPLKDIKVMPEIFQGRSVPFAKETVNKIVREGFDTSQEPIILYKHSKFGNIVISGHSRYEAAKECYKKGDKALKSIPTKFFNGDFDDAVDYAVIESNRSGKAEGIESDIKAYVRAKQRGYNKEFLRSIFKNDSYINQLRDLSALSPKGLFIKHLSQTSERSFPYLLRNAIWVGSLKRIYPELTKSHEKEMFDFFYTSGNKGLTVKKQSFFDTVKKRVESPLFKKKDSLKLRYNKEFERISSKDPGFIKYRQIQSAINQRNAERNRKEQLFVFAKEQNNTTLAKKLESELSDLTHSIRMKYIDLLRIKIQLGKEDKRLKSQGLFD